MSEDWGLTFGQVRFPWASWSFGRLPEFGVRQAFDDSVGTAESN